MSSPECRNELDHSKRRGEYPIHRAAIRGNVKVIEFLLKYGARTDVVNKDKKTPLQLVQDQPDLSKVFETFGEINFIVAATSLIKDILLIETSVFFQILESR